MNIRFIKTLAVLAVAMIPVSCEFEIGTFNYIKFNVNGKDYEGKSRTLSSNSYYGDGCSRTLQKDLLEFTSADFDLELSIIHYEEEIDFDTFRNAIGTGLLEVGNNSSACHLDLIVQFKDKKDPKGTSTLLKNGTAKIESVRFLESADGVAEFSVTGTFAGVFENLSGQSNQVSGSFKVSVETESSD